MRQIRLKSFRFALRNGPFSLSLLSSLTVMILVCQFGLSDQWRRKDLVDSQAAVVVAALAKERNARGLIQTLKLHTIVRTKAPFATATIAHAQSVSLCVFDSVVYCSCILPQIPMLSHLNQSLAGSSPVDDSIEPTKPIGCSALQFALTLVTLCPLLACLAVQPISCSGQELSRTRAAAATSQPGATRYFTSDQFCARMCHF